MRKKSNAPLSSLKPKTPVFSSHDCRINMIKIKLYPHESHVILTELLSVQCTSLPRSLLGVRARAGPLNSRTRLSTTVGARKSGGRTSKV
jgi:hypothetical protein